TASRSLLTKFLSRRFGCARCATGGSVFGSGSSSLARASFKDTSIDSNHLHACFGTLELEPISGPEHLPILHARTPGLRSFEGVASIRARHHLRPRRTDK